MRYVFMALFIIFIVASLIMCDDRNDENGDFEGI